MKLTCKITGIILLAALMISADTIVFADPAIDSLTKQKQQLQDQENQNNQYLQQNQTNADSAQHDIQAIESKIEDLDFKIENLNRTISATNIKIAAKENEIKISQQNIDKAQADISAEQDLFCQRMRAMYVGSEYSQFLSLLLSSKDFDAFLTNLQAVDSIVKYDNRLMKDLSDKEAALKAAEVVLNNDMNTLAAFKQDNTNKLAQVQSDMQNQQQLVAEKKSKQAFYLSQVSSYRNKIADENNQIQAATNQIQAIALAEQQAAAAAATAAAEAAKKQSNNNTSGTNTSGNNTSNVPPAPNAIVAYAYKFLGDPYVWGAEGDIFTQADIDMYGGTVHDLTGMQSLLGRQAFDCSGLTQYVYAHFGIHIGRTTYDQINDGTPVDRSKLQPGDLILFGTWDAPHHVGMYVGNNCYIQAPYSGDVVRVSSLDGVDDYLCARRILGT